MLDWIGIFLLLFSLELVLGIDNILVITLLVAKLDEHQQNKARILGLTLAFFLRILMLIVLLHITGLNHHLFWKIGIRELVLLSGGMFLIWKAIREIHHTVEFIADNEYRKHKSASQRFGAAIRDIVIMDAVFSIDSVITAIGLTRELWIIVAAVFVSLAIILAFSKPVGDFILKRPSIKILALAFLVTIGITLIMEGLHQEVPRAYLYLPMGFALVVELIQMRYEHNKKARLQSKE